MNDYFPPADDSELHAYKNLLRETYGFKLSPLDL